MKIFDIKQTKEGYIIKTNGETITLAIAEEAVRGGCCEIHGYLFTEDNISEFIGSDLISVSITDTLFNRKKLDILIKDQKIDTTDKEENTVFVNIETSNGLLQFVAYNYHNGYYGHNVKITSKKSSNVETIFEKVI